MTQKAFFAQYANRLQGKTIAISGATGGLGRELCRLLAQNGASVILIDRNQEKQNAFLSELREQFPTTQFYGIVADMEQMESVKALEKQLLEYPLDGLILNAGAYSIPRRKTSVGYDNVFQINFLSPYYLAKKMLPHLQARSGRIVVVGSIAHNYSKTDPDDIDFSKRARASLVYGNAKRYLMFSALDLAWRGEPVAVAHPGISFTGITAHYPKWIFSIIKHPMKWIFMKPKRACLSIYAALFELPSYKEWIGPRCFDIWGLPKIKKLNTATEAEREFICQTAATLFDKMDSTENSSLHLYEPNYL